MIFQFIYYRFYNYFNNNNSTFPDVSALMLTSTFQIINIITITEILNISYAENIGAICIFCLFIWNYILFIKIKNPKYFFDKWKHHKKSTKYQLNKVVLLYIIISILIFFFTIIKYN